ncbi:MAG: sugar phosphate nucleotidyltransferase [Bacteroidales bacterium]|nr:sugar phosphate nucleotidyltransferase [Bacteroidales bacterium]
MKAMILAAGYGTRLQPLTNSKPKALIDIKGVPLLELVIQKLKKEGISDIIINVHHFAHQVVNFLKENKNFGINIQISDESEQLLDTGGGILKAKWFFENGPAFLVYNVDILSAINLGEFMKYHSDNKPLATLAVQERTTTRQLLFDQENRLCEWRNVQTGERKISREGVGELKPLAFSGIHILDNKIFELMDENGAFSIMQTYLRLAKEHDIIGFNHSSTSWFEFGRFEHVKEFNEREELGFL